MEEAVVPPRNREAEFSITHIAAASPPPPPPSLQCGRMVFLSEGRTEPHLLPAIQPEQAVQPFNASQEWLMKQHETSLSQPPPVFRYNLAPICLSRFCNAGDMPS